MISAKLKKIRTQFKKDVDCGKKSGSGRSVFTFDTICQNIQRNSPVVITIGNSVNSFTSVNSPAVTAIGNSVGSSYSGNGSSSMSDETANSSAQLGSQDDFAESDNKATFEDFPKDETHIHSTPAQVSSCEQAGGFLKDCSDKQLTTHFRYLRYPEIFEFKVFVRSNN